MDLYNIDVIKCLLAKHGFRFSKSLGQNFLTAKWVPEKIVACSPIDANSAVLEIGPGIGVLTRELSKSCSKVVSVEIDSALLPLLQESLADRDNVEIVHANALKVDIQSLVNEKFSGFIPRVCANLPYNITSPILTHLIDSGCFASLTVMVQKEVAERMCAQAGTENYGAFSVYIHYHTVPEILFDVPPDCFIPQPKVTSSVVTLTRRQKPADVLDETMFFKVVRASFAQRRKTLVNGLFAVFGHVLTKENLTELVEQCGFDARVRGETLSLAAFTSIANALYTRLLDTTNPGASAGIR